MRGKFIYFAFYSLVGSLAAFSYFPLYVAIGMATAIYLKKVKSFSSHQLGICLGLLSLFFLNTEAAIMSNKSTLNGKEQEFQIRINGDVEFNGNSFSAEVVEVHSGEKLLLRYRIRSAIEKQKLQGAIEQNLLCNTRGKIEKPKSSQNNPQSFQFEKYLHQNQIFWILTTHQFNLSQCQNQPLTFFSFLEKARQKGIGHLEETFPASAAALSAALIFGERDLISPEVEQDFIKIGVIHLISISGLHIGLLAAMLFYIFMRVGLTREKSIVLLIILLPIYALLTGAAPPVIRAILMIILILIERLLFRSKGMPVDALSIAFMIYVFRAPFTLLDIGFQLSFIVTFALIISSKSISRAKSSAHQLLMISLVAQLASLPILLFYFYEVSLVSIFANVIFVPFFSVIILPLSFISFAASLISNGISLPFITLLFYLVDISNHAADIFSSLPFASVVIGKPSVSILSVLCISILLVFINMENKIEKSILKKFIYCLPVLIIVFHLLMTHFSPYGKVVFVDVGQGDSIFIKLPFNQGNILIDTGGVLSFTKEHWEEKREEFDTGKDIVIPFLKSEGITSVDMLILTHGDLDHIGGAISILKEMRVKKIVMPQGQEHAGLEKEIINLARVKRIPIQFVGAGDRLRAGKTDFFVLSPQPDQPLQGNDSSIVIKAFIGGLEWLFTGDLEKEGEDLFMKSYPQLDIDVLKVGHHGSKSSSSEEFLSYVDPEIAIISVGAENRFGHPNSEVLKRLTDRQIAIYRTDRHGAITYTFKRNKGTFLTVLP